jgi:hypothetical protein
MTSSSTGGLCELVENILKLGVVENLVRRTTGVSLVGTCLEATREKLVIEDLTSEVRIAERIFADLCSAGFSAESVDGIFVLGAPLTGPDKEDEFFLPFFLQQRRFSLQ